MAQTNISSPTSYCTPAQGLTYRDARQWGDVLGDANARIAADQNPALQVGVLNPAAADIAVTIPQSINVVFKPWMNGITRAFFVASSVAFATKS